jgi:catechol 2,3-dioxygenase-like lactoylglutathione lyase family enzyme
MNAPIRLASSALIVCCLIGCTSTRRANIPRVNHIRIEVSDMNASLAFYRDTIGLRAKSISPEFSWLEANNMSLALSALSSPRSKEDRPGLGMYPHFEVADVEAVTARCKAAGYRIVQEPMQNDRFTEAFVADPDGYVWALFRWH